MRKSTKTALLIHLFLYFIALILALKVFDVARLVPEYAELGLSTVNGWFRGLFRYGEAGYSTFWYVFTEVLGYVSMAVCAFWTVLCVREVIRSGRLDGVGVDKNLLATAFLYLLTALLCVLFRFVPVNYRPVLLAGQTQLAPSFPSAHVTLYIVSMGSTVFHVWEALGKKKKAAVLLTVLCTVVMAAGTVGRLVAGVNWLTDIVGGMLLGGALLILYSFFFEL